MLVAVILLIGIAMCLLWVLTWLFVLSRGAKTAAQVMPWEGANLGLGHIKIPDEAPTVAH